MQFMSNLKLRIAHEIKQSYFSVFHAHLFPLRKSHAKMWRRSVRTHQTNANTPSALCLPWLLPLWSQRPHVASNADPVHNFNLSPDGRSAWSPNRRVNLKPHTHHEMFKSNQITEISVSLSGYCAHTHTHTHSFLKDTNHWWKVKINSAATHYYDTKCSSGLSRR